MVEINDNSPQKVKILDIKTVITLGVMLVFMSAARATMSAKVERFGDDLSEIKRGYQDADLRLQSQVDDISGALALQAVSLGKIEAGVAYIQRSIDNLQKEGAP